MNNQVPMIGLYRGKSLVSKLINFQTRGVYSHAAFHYDTFVIEAWATRPLLLQGSVYKNEPGTHHTAKTPVDLFVINANFSDRNLEDAEAFLAKQIGKKYDYRMITGFVTRASKENKSSSDKWFCSELVYAYLQKLRVPLFAETRPFEVSPDMLKRLSILQYQTTIEVGHG